MIGGVILQQSDIFGSDLGCVDQTAHNAFDYSPLTSQYRNWKKSAPADRRWKTRR